MLSRSSVVGFVGSEGCRRHSVMYTQSGFCKNVSKLGARERILAAWDVAYSVKFCVVGEEVEGEGVVL